MAEVQNVSVVPIPSPLQLGHRHIDHILQLEDDCLAAIMRTFSLDELCAAAETCRRLESVARQAFVLREECRSYEISDVNLELVDHCRILNHFGKLISHVQFSCGNVWPETVPIGNDIAMHETALTKCYNLAERYCGESLLGLRIQVSNECFFPPSAQLLISKLQKLHLKCGSISSAGLHAALSTCKQLVQLELSVACGTDTLTELRFPNLRKLSICVRIDRYACFKKLEDFCALHPNLVDLSMSVSLKTSGKSVGMNFVSHLPKLKKLKLTLDTLVTFKAVGAFKCLKNLKQFDAKLKSTADILLCLGSVDTLEALELDDQHLDDKVLAGISRFRNLKTLRIMNAVEVSGLARLANSRLVELEIYTYRFTKQEQVPDIVRHLRHIKFLKLPWNMKVNEAFCKSMAVVCVAQKRKINITLAFYKWRELSYTTFVGKFNAEHNQFVEFLSN